MFPATASSNPSTIAGIAAGAMLLLFSTAAGGNAATFDTGTNSAPPSDLQASIGFLSLVQLPCLYQPASVGAHGGHMTLFNPSGRSIERGRPVTYRLSATGEHFTVHLKNNAAPGTSMIVKHHHAEFTRCEAWTYIR